MDERNIKGVIIGVLMIVGFIGIMVFIMNYDKKTVEKIDTSEAEKIIEERKKEKEKKVEEPHSTYYVKLDEDRNLVSDVDEKCYDDYDCSPKKEHNTLKITDSEYKLVMDLYNGLYTKEWPNNTKATFIVAVASLAEGDKEMYSSNIDGWSLYKKYDNNVDGKVTYREFAEYVLDVFTYREINRD